MTIYGKFKYERKEFFLNVEFEIPSVGVTAIFGPSGCGKTTLLRLLAGLEVSCESIIKVDEHIWQNENTYLKPHLRSVGYVFQEASIFPHLSVKDNLTYALKRAIDSNITFQDAIELLGISHLLDRMPRHLSGGERQRVAIAQALLSSPKVLLMDEPLVGLDEASVSELLPFLEKINKELSIPILYVSHSLSEVIRLADNIILMKKGEIKASGKLLDILPNLQSSLSSSDKACSVFETIVKVKDQKNHLTTLVFKDKELYIPHDGYKLGDKIRVKILAKDVSLTLKQYDSSILNVIPGTIIDMVEISKGQYLIKLDIEGVPLFSKITKKSVSSLNLSIGQEVFAQIKGIAIIST